MELIKWCHSHRATTGKHTMEGEIILTRGGKNILNINKMNNNLKSFRGQGCC